MNDSVDPKNGYIIISGSSLQNSIDCKANSIDVYNETDIYTKFETDVLLGTKQNTAIGAATTVASSNLFINRAFFPNASGKIDVSPITSTELGYLIGTESIIQQQIHVLNSTVSAAFLNIY
jgi:hypothetical protein